MSYSYKITSINEKERWIYIEDENPDEEIEWLMEPDGFINLVNKITNNDKSKIVEVGNIQYRITTDTLDLIYQWDDLFGIVVIYGEKENKDEVVGYLKKYF